MPLRQGGSKGRQWGEKAIAAARLDRPPNARRYRLRLHLRGDRREASADRGGPNPPPRPKTGPGRAVGPRTDCHAARPSRTAFDNRDARCYRIPRGPRGDCRRYRTRRASHCRYPGRRRRSRRTRPGARPPRRHYAPDTACAKHFDDRDSRGVDCADEGVDRRGACHRSRSGGRARRAPAAGTIAHRAARLGAVVSLAGEPLFRLVRNSEIEFDAEVPETMLPQIVPGQNVEVWLAGVGEAIGGYVRLVDPTVDKMSRLRRVAVALSAHPGLRAGIFARGNITLGRGQAGTAPLSAVLFGKDGTYVQLATNN